MAHIARIARRTFLVFSVGLPITAAAAQERMLGYFG